MKVTGHCSCMSEHNVHVTTNRLLTSNAGLFHAWHRIPALASRKPLLRCVHIHMNPVSPRQVFRIWISYNFSLLASSLITKQPHGSSNETWFGASQGDGQSRPGNSHGLITTHRAPRGRIPPYTVQIFDDCILSDLVAPLVPNRSLCIFLAVLTMRVECVYTQCIVCGWRQDALKKKNVVAFREYYCIQCGGNLLIDAEVREQRQETKNSRGTQKTLDMVRITILKRLK